jgi:anti-sigma regulatory factor (Ser/Thr protein kinase)
LRFARPGLDAGEPVAIAIPGPKADLLRPRLRRFGADVELLDMFDLGRNPARIIPAVQAMLERCRGERLHYVGEPLWPGRSLEEIREATRHEALINLAWPGVRIRVLCPYDATALDASVLADAERTHPYVIRDGESGPSPVYAGPKVPHGCEVPLPDPPPGAAMVAFGRDDLSDLRGMIADRATDAGLGEARVEDLVLAVNELATNTIRHTGSRGRLWMWCPPGEVVCQVVDPGYIADPLAGRRHPGLAADGGMGLWMVNQLCDLVELRTTVAGMSVRVHVTATPTAD